jgi:hypothetical protein
MNSRTVVATFYALLGASSLANGLWMLLSPAGWYSGIPAAVPDTGPLNFHFVHDLGVVFSVAGLGGLWCARNLDRCRPVHLGLMLFFSGHALVHVAEILSGRLSHAHWWIDLPLTFSPALALLLLSVPAVWNRWVNRPVVSP